MRKNILTRPEKVYIENYFRGQATHPNMLPVRGQLGWAALTLEIKPHEMNAEKAMALIHYGLGQLEKEIKEELGRLRSPLRYNFAGNMSASSAVLLAWLGLVALNVYLYILAADISPSITTHMGPDKSPPPGMYDLRSEVISGNATTGNSTAPISHTHSNNGVQFIAMLGNAFLSLVLLGVGVGAFIGGCSAMSERRNALYSEITGSKVKKFAEHLNKLILDEQYKVSGPTSDARNDAIAKCEDLLKRITLQRKVLDNWDQSTATKEEEAGESHSLVRFVPQDPIDDKKLIEMALAFIGVQEGNSYTLTV